MCIDEGSTDGFKKELERTYNYNGRNEIDPELEIESLEVHFSGFHYENFVRHGLCSNDPFGKDTHALLRLLKTRGSVESIFTRCEKRKIERSSKAEHAGSVRSRGT